MHTRQPEFDAVTPYRYVGGDRSIDFVNTVDWTGRGREADRFTSYDRLIEWAEGADALPPKVLGALRRSARRDAYEAERVLREAVELRTLLERTFFRLTQGSGIAAELAALSQGWLRHSLAQIAVVEDGGAAGSDGASWSDGASRSRAIGARGGMTGNRGAAGGRGEVGESGFALGWPRAAQALESPLWSVAWSAARLLTSADAARIRRCGGIDCGWYYVDRSRNGLRRWCEMETCGTLMKSHRRAERNARARKRSAGAARASDAASRKRG